MDGIHVTQPKRFLPLAQEVKKLVEKFQKEEIASQWAGLPPEKLLQESFVEQLNAMWTLNLTNNPSGNLDSIWENSWLTCMTHNMLAPFTMQKGRREIP